MTYRPGWRPWNSGSRHRRRGRARHDRRPAFEKVGKGPGPSRGRNLLGLPRSVDCPGHMLEHEQRDWRAPIDLLVTAPATVLPSVWPEGRTVGGRQRNRVYLARGGLRPG